jgi:hypothetical protein
LSDPPTSLLLILFKYTNLLKCLHDLAIDTSTSIDVVGWARATVTGGAVDFAKTTNTNGFSEIDVTGDRSSTDVEPVNGLRWELLGWASLDSVNPTCG